MVQVLPAIAPHLDALLPALIGAEQDHLERLRERRLPRPVATDDQSEPWTRLDRQRRGRADPAETLDLDGGEIHPAGCCPRGTACRRGTRLAAERGIDRLRALEGGEDQVRGPARRRIRVEPVDHQAEQRGVRHPVPMVCLSHVSGRSRRASSRGRQSRSRAYRPSRGGRASRP